MFFMMNLIYAFFILGCFPVGYLILRTGFPFTQKLSGLKKIGISYLIGLIIFGLPIILLEFMKISEKYFFVVCFVFFATIFIIFYAKRIIFEEKEPVMSFEGKKKITLVQKKEEENKVTPKKISFEQGLMIKSNKREEETKKQVFKEKEGNILKVLEKNTKEIESKNREEEKKEALKRLREFAKHAKLMNQTKNKNNSTKTDEMDEIEEDLLNNLEDIDEIK
jgi:hypothetical protein